ncbi:MAG TPA: hypothetical protein VKI00_13155 [Mycobacterium sp.]|uniref:hypothetical protein n=1 Tax=Mycobacterium sp. TaxID=1785 RepID=UPI002C941D96|nr:hypothetical protein [Mycobacterium sp.]HME76558.1 hypothetical protein [Mycobacterium sp.]
MPRCTHPCRRPRAPPTVTRLLLGALTRGAMLIANSEDPVGTRHAVAQSMRALLAGFTVGA